MKEEEKIIEILEQFDELGTGYFDDSGIVSKATIQILDLISQAEKRGEEKGLKEYTDWLVKRCYLEGDGSLEDKTIVERFLSERLKGTEE